MRRNNRKPGIATLCIHAGDTQDPATGAVMPPIHTSVTFARPDPDSQQPYIYSRAGNPTRDALERCLAELEGGTRALAFASGMAATATVLELLDAGAHLIAPFDGYGGTFRIMSEVRPRSAGLQVSFVDCCDLGAIERAIRPETRMLWLETPTNPLLRIQDLSGAVAIARRHGILTVADNTFATPMLQRPLEHGCDIVMHSATKYLGGHGDLTAGVVATSAELAQRIRLEGLKDLTGAVMSPHDAHGILRGLKTLHLRMQRHGDNAQAIAEMLAAHPQVAAVHYPGLPSFPQHELAQRQMDGLGGMVAFELVGGIDAGRRFMNALQLVTRAVSLGDAETLAQHPASMTHSTYTPEERARHGIAEGLIRLSAGLEETDDILADLRQALRHAAAPPRATRAGAGDGHRLSANERR